MQRSSCWSLNKGVWRLFLLQLACALAAAIALAPESVGAHERSVSYSSWRIHGTEASVRLRVRSYDLTRFPWVAGELEARIGEYMAKHLVLITADEEPCTVENGPRSLRSEPGYATYEWTLRCARGVPSAVRSELFRQEAPSHLHFARVQSDFGKTAETVLTDTQRVFHLDAGKTFQEPQPASFGSYILLGIEHVLGGYDHLLFVISFLLIGASIGEVARVVTGFTLAHSATLALSVLGYLRPQQEAIEALIGLSIVLVATENVWLQDPRRSGAIPWTLGALIAALAAAATFGFGSVPALTLAGLALFVPCYFHLLRKSIHPERARWTVAMLFGLVHGFGFAGVLLEAELPTDRLARALFGFNLGVEAGQLAVVGLLWPIVRFVRRWLANEPAYALAVSAGSAIILAVGVFWFVTRAYG